MQQKDMNESQVTRNGNLRMGKATIRTLYNKNNKQMSFPLLFQAMMNDQQWNALKTCSKPKSYTSPDRPLVRISVTCLVNG